MQLAHARTATNIRFLIVFAFLLTASAVTPVQQVLNMLTKMKQQGQDRAAKERQLYAEYLDWAEDRRQELGFEIKAATNSIEELKATMAKSDTDHTMFTKKADDLKTSIESLRKELEAARAQRKSQSEEYKKKSRDLRESVDALKRAIDTVTRENYDRPQAEAYMQREAASSAGMVRILAAFIQLGQPEVDAYKSQSGDLLKTLKALLTKFGEELDEVETEEINQARAFDLLELHTLGTINHEKRNRQKAQMEAAKAGALAKKSAASKALAEKELMADETLSRDIKSTLEAKTSTFNENQKFRKAELEAISKVIKIISSPEVSSLVQVPTRAVLLQSAIHKRRSTARAEALKLLRRRARALKSRSLAAIASGIASEGSFDHIIKMIEDMLGKLKAEASSEQEHKEWCDEEVGTNKEKRDEKTLAAEKHLAEIDAKTSLIETLARKVQMLSAEQAKLADTAKVATSQREQEKSEHEETVKETEQGIAAIEKATAVLKEFYEQQGASFMEVGSRTAPEMKAYKGMTDSKGGAIGMLEVILSDFRRLKSDTEAAESKAKKEYDDFIAANDKAKASKAKEQETLEQDADKAKEELTEEKDGLQSVKKELKAANEYFENIKPLCLAVRVSFDERIAARNEELKALNQAYDILSKKAS